MDFFGKLKDYWPSWASGIPGSRLFAVIRASLQIIDGVALRARRAFRRRFIEYQVGSELDSTGAERSLKRLYGEADSSYRSRLKAAPLFWRKAGTDLATEEAFALLGYRAEVISNKDWKQKTWDSPTNKWDDPYSFWDSGPPDGATTFWNRIWVKIYVPWELQKWDSPANKWDSPANKWDAAGIPAQEYEDWITLVQSTKASYNLFMGFIFYTPTEAVFVPVGDSGR